MWPDWEERNERVFSRPQNNAPLRLFNVHFPQDKGIRYTRPYAQAPYRLCWLASNSVPGLPPRLTAAHRRDSLDGADNITGTIFILATFLSLFVNVATCHLSPVIDGFQQRGQ